MSLDTPNSTLETSGETIKPKIEKLQTITENLVGFLTEKGQIEFKTKQRRIKELLGLIRDEVKKQSDEYGYDYDFNDYRKRLSITDKVFEKIFNERVLVGDFKSYYDEVIQLGGSTEIVKQKLLTEYKLEDLVYESLENGEYDNNVEKQIYDGALQERIKNNNWADLKGVNINSPFSNWGRFRNDKLNVIFKHFKGVKCIKLSWNNIGNLGKDKLNIIFKHLEGVSYIDLGYNNLGNLGKEELTVIFKHLKQVKSIYLGNTNLGKLGKDELNIIFKYLKGIKCIDLTSNSLVPEQQEYIQTLLPNAKLIF